VTLSCLASVTSILLTNARLATNIFNQNNRISRKLQTLGGWLLLCVAGTVLYPNAQPALQRQNTEISKQIFPEKEYRGLSPNFHIHASVSDLYIPTMGLPILLEEIWRLILGLYTSLTDT
jgi:hypothetical protein